MLTRFDSGRDRLHSEVVSDVDHCAGAKALRLEGYGIAVGASADFVTMRAEHVPEAVVAVPRERTVYRRGRVVAQGGKVLEQSPKSY